MMVSNASTAATGANVGDPGSSAPKYVGVAVMDDGANASTGAAVGNKAGNGALGSEMGGAYRATRVDMGNWST